MVVLIQGLFSQFSFIFSVTMKLKTLDKLEFQQTVEENK